MIQMQIPIKLETNINMPGMAEVGILLKAQK